MYAKYEDMKSEHVRLVKYYKEIDDRIEKLKEALYIKDTHITETNVRIDYIIHELENAKAEETAQNSVNI